MTLQVLTPIYPPHIKPVRDGWYLTEVPGTLMWQLRWWGGRWYASDMHHSALASIFRRKA